jgi:hypothetical protein
MEQPDKAHNKTLVELASKFLVLHVKSEAALHLKHSDVEQ